MPKVRPVPETENPILPVRVLIRVIPRDAGIPVEVKLVFPAAWKGNILPQHQTVYTDDTGTAQIMLPPTEEMVWLVSAPPKLKPFFQVEIPGHGSFPVHIPAGVETHTIGE